MVFRVVDAMDMPDSGVNATPIVFGDFGCGYPMMDPARVQVLQDPYSTKFNFRFYKTKRVSGEEQDVDGSQYLGVSRLPFLKILFQCGRLMASPKPSLLISL